MSKYFPTTITIPTKKIKQLISYIVLLIPSSFPLLLKLLPFLSPLFNLMPSQPTTFQPLEEEEGDEESQEFQDLQECTFSADHKAMEGRSSSLRHDRASSLHDDDHGRSQQPMMTSRAVSDLGSMRRREKEWSRTLECKILEDRHNVGDGEGMDMLWEVYERTEEGGERERCGEKEEVKSKNRIVDYLEEFEEEESGQVSDLCCLKALRFSPGKMHFGMKISKAFKGMRAGLLNHHHRRKKKKKKKEEGL